MPKETQGTQGPVPVSRAPWWPLCTCVRPPSVSLPCREVVLPVPQLGGGIQGCTQLRSQALYFLF